MPRCRLSPSLSPSKTESPSGRVPALNLRKLGGVDLLIVDDSPYKPSTRWTPTSTSSRRTAPAAATVVTSNRAPEVALLMADPQSPSPPSTGSKQRRMSSSSTVRSYRQRQKPTVIDSAARDHTTSAWLHGRVNTGARSRREGLSSTQRRRSTRRPGRAAQVVGSTSDGADDRSNRSGLAPREKRGWRSHPLFLAGVAEPPLNHVSHLRSGYAIDVLRRRAPRAISSTPKKI